MQGITHCRPCGSAQTNGSKPQGRNEGQRCRSKRARHGQPADGGSGNFWFVRSFLSLSV